MLHIFIEGKNAVLKEGTSFEYVSENRLFSGADGFSFTITFPLRGCPRNLEIFGNVNRTDVVANKVVFDCEIHDLRFHKYGCLVLTEFDEVEVKAQFLDGRSADNFNKTFDKIYINDLELGEPETTDKNELTAAEAVHGIDLGNNAVTLPWVNANSDSGNIQNKMIYVPALENEGQVVRPAHIAWSDDCRGLSWQPYLIYIAKKICEEIGYAYDFSAWEESEEYRNLIICNVLPYTWYLPQFARALPHWSIEEFFAKLELFMGAEFEFNHRAKIVKCSFTSDILQSIPTVQLTQIVDAHDISISTDSKNTEYAQSRNLAYKEDSNQMFKYYSCDWFIRDRSREALRYSSMSELLSANRSLANWDGKNHRGSNINRLMYAADVDAYFIVRAISRSENGMEADGKTKRWIYKCILQPVNLLGARIVDESDDAPQDEIDFVPACIDYTDEDNGFCLFMNFSGYDEENTPYNGASDSEPFSDEWYAEKNSRFAEPGSVQTLKAGEAKKKAEYYDKIYIAWWDGSGARPSLPCPSVENIKIEDDWSSFQKLHFSLRLNDRRSARYVVAPEINNTQKMTFKFFSEVLPSPRALYLINGRRYVCEKLTATFTERGMSEIIKGEFYPVRE